MARRPLAARPRLTHACADLASGSARAALAGADIVYHLAAQVWQGRGPAGLAGMEAVNVEGTRNVLAARPGAVVFASSAAVYGAWPDNPLPLAEHHPPRPNPECAYARHKLTSEEICTASGVPTAVLRLAAVVGPHADARVVRALRGYRLLVPEITGAPQAVQWLDEHDAVDAVLAAGRALLDGAPLAGEVVNVATEDWLGGADMARLAHSRLIRLPRRAVVGGSELGRRLGLTPFGADRSALINGPLALGIKKAGALLGWEPSRTSAEVFGEALGRGWRGLPRNRQ